VTAFYNEPDPYAAAWLRNLIAARHIAPGIVDERPIQQIEAWELVGFTQCHFFAGIGVWSLALRRAGWPDDQPIWTGSCPCQPFSAAGQRKGISDERHLWPFWIKLIDQCKPAIVVGEQVASKDGLGWLDLVSTDLEASDYAFAAADLCAAGFSGAHLRQRLYFVGLADDDDTRLEGRDGVLERGNQRIDGPGGMAGGLAGGLADTLPTGRSARRAEAGSGQVAGGGASNELEHSDKSGQHERTPGRKQSLRYLGDRSDEISDGGDQGQIASRWLDADWLLCRNPTGEPSWRPVEPGTFPLDNAVAGRMGLLRAYGNALDEETAEGFCATVREIVDDLRSVREFDL